MRHGEVDNPDGILYGRLPGFGLTALGRRMAAAAAEHVVAEGREVGLLRTSPLQRALESTAPLSGALGLDPERREGLIEASSQLRNIAISFMKINNDLRWMGSGPNTGLGEIQIPDLQPGSSIMPGKVNPVIPEAVIMVGARVIGNDATIAWAGATGNFELNVAIPVMGTALLESIRLLANSTVLLADKTVDGLRANLDRARAMAESSPSIVTPLNKFIGYESAAKIAKHAVASGITIREAVIDLGFVERGEISEEQLDKSLDVLSMTHPG